MNGVPPARVTVSGYELEGHEITFSSEFTRKTTVIRLRGANQEGGIVPVLREFYVSGIFEVGLQEHDSALALVNLEDAEALRGLAGPTAIRLKFDDVLKAPVLARGAVSRITPGLRLREGYSRSHRPTSLKHWLRSAPAPTMKSQPLREQPSRLRSRRRC